MRQILNQNGQIRVNICLKEIILKDLFDEDLFVDGNDFSSDSIEKGRNLFYQKQLAAEMRSRMNEILVLLSSSMNIHLNIGQNSTINTPNVYLSMETISSNGLINKKIEQVGNAQIQLPSQFNLTLNANSTFSLRVCSENNFCQECF